MDKNPSPPIRRMKVVIQDHHPSALRKIAKAERRTPHDQAAVLLHSAIEAALAEIEAKAVAAAKAAKKGKAMSKAAKTRGRTTTNA